MISIEGDSSLPLYQRIYEAIRDDIMNGSLAPGQKLEPIRSLAASLNVSRNTVENAYAQLAAEGYVTSRSGSGYTVSDIDFSALEPGSGEAPAGGPTLPMEPSIAQPQAKSRTRKPKAQAAAGKPIIDFTYGDRPKGSFPASTWRKLETQALNSADSQASEYGDAFGDMSLRREIAHRIRLTRGVRCEPEQIIIQAGTQAGLGNLLKLFDASRDIVAMDNPGYDGATAVFANRGFSIRPISVLPDDDPDDSVFIKELFASDANLLFCTPSNQFPFGMTMPLQKRIRLIEWAVERDGYIFEDDYCREFRYEGRPIPSLQSIDTHGRVVYMGTFSKILSPTMRASYLVLPPELLQRWRTVFAHYYSQVPWLTQKTLSLFMSEGLWERYARKTAQGYQVRRNILVESLQRYMDGKIDIYGGASGLHLLVSTHDDRNEDELIEAAANAGVRVYPTSNYWLDTTNARVVSLKGRCVLIGFSSIETTLIDEGVQRLAKAWFGADA